MTDNNDDVQSWAELSDSLMAFVNEGNMIHRNSTGDTWPALRDAFFIRHSLLEDLGAVEFKPRKDSTDSTQTPPTIH